MLASLWKNGLTSLFKEVRVFKVLSLCLLSGPCEKTILRLRKAPAAQRTSLHLDVEILGHTVQPPDAR